jgi:predicted Zn-dependent protease
MFLASVALLMPGSGQAQMAGPTLVMPFDRGAGDAHLYWLGEGVAVLLAEELSDLGANALSRPERIAAFEHLSLPTSVSLSHATIIKVGQLLGAADVVVGSLEVEDRALVLHARVIELDAGRQGPEVTEAGPLGDLLGIARRTARRLAGAAMPPGGTSSHQHPPVEAFENYVKGLVAETPTSQARFLERAVGLYSGYDEARLALWAVRSEQGDHASALAAARAVPRDSTVARRARFDAALSLVDMARYAEAFAELTALAEERPAAALFNNLGIVQLRRDGAPQAGMPTHFLTKAADAEPGASDYAFNLGYAYARQHDWSGAGYWLREAVRRNPADADAHFVLGIVLESTGAHVEAGRERDLARQLSAGYEDVPERATGADTVPPGLERLMRTLETPRVEQLDAAILGTLQREQDELARFHLDRGRRLVTDKRDREAIAELRRAIYLSPYLAEAHLLLGGVYLRSGRPREAVDALKIAIWSRDAVEAHLTLARAYLQLDDEAAAAAEARRAQALDPTSSEAKRLLDELAKRGGGQVPQRGPS